MRTPAPPSGSRERAVALHRTGDLAAAEPLYRALLAADARDPELHYLLAVLLFQGGRAGDAVESARRALRLRPGDAASLMLLGLAEGARGRPAAALKAHDRALAVDEARWDLHVNRAAALLDLGRPAEALAASDRALALHPGAAEAHAGRGDALRGLGRPGDAHAAYEAALLLGFEPARERRDALTLPAPGEDAGAMNARAVLLAELGRVDEALALLGRAMAVAPDAPVLLYNFGLFGGFRPGHPHREALERLDPAALDAGAATYLHFARARAAADGGEPDAAFAQLALGNALARAPLRHDPDSYDRLAERVRDAFTPALMAARARAGAGNGPRPVFVIGMPRSGSTLIERILAGHPRAASAGESDAFRAALGALGLSTPYPELVPALSAAEFGRLGADTLARMGPLPAGTAAAVDKTLVNAWHVGLILLALPGARFVHARRDPLDAGLSCYEQLFNTDQPFAYDLREIGRYSRSLSAVMDHWRAVLPPDALIAVDYEALVADPERQARRLVAHAGLEWDPACLDAGRAGGRVSTASVAQVRRPVSRGSVGRWRDVARHLGPLLQALGLDAEGRPVTAGLPGPSPGPRG